MALARAAARRQRELEKNDEKKKSSDAIQVIKPGDGVTFPKYGDEVSVVRFVKRLAVFYVI